MIGWRHIQGWGRRGLLMLLVAAGLIVFVSHLVYANYAAAQRLRLSLRTQALSDAVQQAQPLADFIAEQQESLADLASSADVVSYHENQALGMSLEYGLRQSLLLIGERFDQLRERRRHGASAVFARIALIGTDGMPLVDSPASGLPTDAGDLARAPVTRSVSLDPDHRYLRLSAPVQHRGRRIGSLVAWIGIDLARQIAGCESVRDHTTWLLLADDPASPLGAAGQQPLPVALPRPLIGAFVQEADGALIIAVPVPGLPFLLATRHAADAYLGDEPWHGLVTMVALGAALMGVAGVLMLHMVRGRRLSEMLAEMRIREIDAAERNRVSLDRERSARTQAEEEATQLGYAVEQAAESVVITGIDGVITYVNSAFSQVSGWSREEAVGRTPAILKSGLHDARFYERMWEDLKAGRPWHGRIVNRRRDGSLFHEDATISPVRDADGRISRYIAVKRDVTDLIRMEEQLRQAQKLESIGQLAAGIAHEINTPIQFIGDNLRFLSDGFGELRGAAARPAGSPPADLDYLLAEIPKALSESQEGIRRVAQIVLAMKEFSHPSTQSVVPADMNHAIASTVTVSRNEWKYVAELEQDLAPDLPPVPLLVGDFNQVVLNLIVNAAHAIVDRRTREGLPGLGRIRIATRIVDGMAEVRISDDGCGIPASIRSRIFEPFFTTKEVGRGTGQGLAIARSVVVTKLGGSIAFESESGVGTTFIIRLPLGSAPQGVG